MTFDWQHIVMVVVGIGAAVGATLLPQLSFLLPWATALVGWALPQPFGAKPQLPADKQ